MYTKIKRELRDFDIVYCLRGDEHFEQGKYYVACGYNNGISVVYVDSDGNCKHKIMHNFGDLLEDPMDQSDGAVFTFVDKCKVLLGR